MNMSEFKAWFEGYTEDLDGAPTAKQFKRIKAQVAKIDGVPITPIIYRDVYWPRVQPYYQQMWPNWSSADVGGILTGGMGMATGGTGTPDKQTITATYAAAMMDAEPTVFDANIALFAVGKADAQFDA